MHSTRYKSGANLHKIPPIVFENKKLKALYLYDKVKKFHMVFYFSGTGNSLWVANELKRVFGGEIVSVAEELRNVTPTVERNGFHHKIENREKIFFVFPVHSWGPAPLMKKYISRLNIDNYLDQDVYAICTCGDNCGNTDRIIRNALKKRNIRLKRCMSIVMPNSYILMKGFGTDDSETEQKKLAGSVDAIKEISENIRTGKDTFPYIRGNNAWLKSGIIYRLFCRFVVGGKQKFHVEDSCTGCGLCAGICPTGTIKMKEGAPSWGTGCVQCTACINRCPAKAIQYGNITQNQGRYSHPSLQ